MFDVAIAGAGFAGVAAAVALAKAGRRVLLIEARGHLGGRAATLVDRATGEPVDNGQHVMFGCYVQTLALLEELGQRDAVMVQPTLHVPFIGPDGVRRDLRCANLPAPLNLAAGLLRWRAIDMRERARAARLAVSLIRGANPRPGETVSVWLTRMGQTRRLRGWLWEPLAVAALNEAPDVAAASMFAPVLRELFSGGRQASSLVLPRVPLGALYAEPARAYLSARGGVVQTGRPARVSVADDGFSVRAGETRWRVPAVISAVPWHQLAALFDAGVPAPLAPIAAAAARMAPVAIVTVNLWYDRPVLDTSFVGLIGRTAQWVFDRRAIAGDSASHVSVITSAASGLSERDDAAIVELITADLRVTLPLAREASVTRATVIREKQATFSVKPGSPARPEERTPVPGLFLAGDWLRTGLPGTIEGAVRSGNRAAYQLLCDPSSSTTTR
ncbi:MAG: hydroxysqualene dehydroxylase HpnE [Acidobacteriota bacterium]|nr:hydroxysqualene dehydroxylase HpnE [Acidobacteriota bacterium]